MHFESTNYTVEETYERFLVCLFFNCVMEDALIIFWGVVLIKYVPKCRILCIREILITIFTQPNFLPYLFYNMNLFI